MQEKSQPDFDLTGIDTELCNVYNEFCQLINNHSNQYIEDSITFTEFQSYSCPNSVATSYNQASVLFEAGLDQLLAFIKTIKEPTQTIAPFTCARAIIESSALASWLFDPKIGVAERVARGFAFQYQGLDQQKKFVQSLDDEKKEERTNFAIAQIENTEAIALNQGFQVLRDRDKRTGIGKIMPGSTEIIRDTMDKESTYRLLSAIIHGHQWALHHLSFRTVNSEDLAFDKNVTFVGPVIEKYLSVDAKSFLCQEVFICLARPIWYKYELFGWNRDQLRGILDKTSNVIKVKEELRFWKLDG